MVELPIRSRGLIPRPSPSVVSYPLDEELVVFDEATQEGFILNGTAAQIWTLADGSRTQESLARQIARSYGIPYREARDDVDELIGGLRQAGLLAGAEAQSPNRSSD